MKTLKIAMFLVVLLAVAMTAMAGGPKATPKSETTPVPASWSSGGYAYDGTGNIYKIGDNDYYVYDAAGRLLEATPLNGSNGKSGDYQTFEYDAYGNLKGLHTRGTTNKDEIELDADPQTNRLNAGTYDPAGNLKQFDNFMYAWDAVGVMVSFAAPNPNATVPDEEYVYDTDDERIETIHHSASDEVTTYTLRGPDQKVLREVTDTLSAGTHNWAWKRDYVYRGDQLLAEVLPGDVTHHFHLDHLGSPRMVSNEAGQRIATMVYWPFGMDAPGTDLGDATDPMRFTGHEKVPVANGFDLYYMHARYQMPRKGRFLSVDPVLGKPGIPQSWNRYSYVLNNPINGTDPDGKDCVGVADCALAVVVMSNPTTWLMVYNYAVTETFFPSPPAINGSIQPTYDEFAIVAPFVPSASSGSRVAAMAEDAELANTARATADAAQASGKTSGAATAFRSADGKIYTSVSGHRMPASPQVQEALDSVPANQRSPFHGSCSECGAATNAENAGSPVKGGRAATVNIKKPGNPAHGTPKPPCGTCKAVMDFLRIFFF